jgi:glycosyltransferase involved in cell wall biosynthesis
MIRRISILVLTYNHEKFIKQCIDSILSQEVEAELEIIVGDDCSPDNTAKILNDYYGNTKIELILREKNIGASLNFIDLISKCTGEYIAYIDGDDYMLPGKLAAQLKVFDENPTVNLVHHNVSEVNFSNEIVKKVKFKGCLEGDINTLLSNCQGGIQSCSIMVKKNKVLNWEKLIPKDSKIQDMPFIYNSLGVGNVAYINKPLSTYRKHSTSITSVTGSAVLEEWTRFFIEQSRTNPIVKPILVNTSLSASYLRDTNDHIRRGDFLKACKSFSASFFRISYPSKALLLAYLTTFKVLIKYLLKL